jgi:hypothetical protein
VSGSRRFTSPPIRARRLSPFLLLAALAAGCGTHPLPPPDPLEIRTPGRTVELRDPRTGLRFQAPRNWVRRIRTNPGIFRIASGSADVSGWAYPRDGAKLPETPEELATARDALVRQAQARNASFRLSSARVTTLQGAPAIELRGTQRIFGKPVETRSVHVYRAGEYVFEALAPAGRQFRVADRRVLEPLLRSLKFRPLPS